MSRQLVARILLAVAASAAVHALVVNLVTIAPPPAVATSTAAAGGLEVRLASEDGRPVALAHPDPPAPPANVVRNPVPPVALPLIPQLPELAALADAQQYYPALDLDERAQPVTDIDIAPPQGKGADYVGVVKLELHIDRDGVVEDVTVVDSTVPQEFQDAAVAAFRAARFTPARKDGQAVKSRKIIEVTYGPPLK
jgi:periplasmic protein TonB